MNVVFFRIIFRSNISWIKSLKMHNLRQEGRKDARYIAAYSEEPLLEVREMGEHFILYWAGVLEICQTQLEEGLYKNKIYNLHGEEGSLFDLYTM